MDEKIIGADIPHPVVWREFDLSNSKNYPTIDTEGWERGGGGSKICLVFVSKENQIKNNYMYPYFLAQLIRDCEDAKPEWDDIEFGRIYGVTHYIELHFWR